MSASPELDAIGRPKRPWNRYRPDVSAETLVLHRRHVALAAFVTGLLLGPRQPFLAAAVMVLMLAVAAREKTMGRRLGAVLLVAALACGVGGVVGRERLRSLDRTVLVPTASFTARGFVVEAPRSRSFGSRVAPMRISVGRGSGERVLLRGARHVRWPRVEVGDEVIARGRLRGLEPFEGFERVRGTHAVLELTALERTGARRFSVFDALRRRAERGLDLGLRGDERALARGMVLGQDQALSEDVRDAFRGSGLAHLVAASGSNVMLLAALVLAVAGALGAMLQTRRLIALVAVLAYVPIAGAGPSIQRAGVMGAAGLVAGLASRPASRWYAVLLAAAGTLCLNPRAAEDVGWQLSFAAVIAILACHHRLSTWLVSRRVPKPPAEATALTVTATAGTAPLMALHFEQLSLVSLPANLLAAPAVAPVMWLGTLAGALGGDAAVVLDALATPLLAYLVWLAKTAAAMPGATASVEIGGPATVVVLYAALALTAMRPRWLVAVIAGGGRGSAGADRRGPVGFGRRGLVVAVAAVMVFVGVARGGPAPPDGFTVSALDIGQGDAILVQDGKHAVLFDTGPPGGPVVKRLKEQGVDDLDALVVTHTSSDHEGGLEAVLKAFDVGLVVDGRQTAAELAGSSGTRGETRFAHVPATQPRIVPAAGQRLRAGPIAIDVLWPPPDADRSGDANLTATVALVTDGGRTALLTADAESPVTLPLDLPHVDLLKVAHHGSRDETLPALIAKTTPRVALISVGPNSYGHPAPETLAALRAVPDVRRTDRGGTASVRLG